MSPGVFEMKDCRLYFMACHDRALCELCRKSPLNSMKVYVMLRHITPDILASRSVVSLLTFLQPSCYKKKMPTI